MWCGFFWCLVVVGFLLLLFWFGLGFFFHGERDHQSSGIPSFHEPSESGAPPQVEISLPFHRKQRPPVRPANCRMTSRHCVESNRAGLVIERLRVRIPAGAAGEISSSELTLCANSYSLSVPPPCNRNGT